MRHECRSRAAVLKSVDSVQEVKRREEVFRFKETFKSNASPNPCRSCYAPASKKINERRRGSFLRCRARSGIGEMEWADGRVHANSCP